MRRSPQAAFTLLEIMLTLAVIVVILAITYPSLETMYSQSRMTAGADGFKAGMLTARAQAVEEGIPYRVALIPGQGNFRVAPDLANYWGGNGSSPPHDADNPSIIVEDNLPKGVIFGESDTPQQPDKDAETVRENVTPSEYKTVAVFMPDGTARDDYKVLLCSRNGHPLWIALRSLTGEVSVVRYQTEGGQ